MVGWLRIKGGAEYSSVSPRTFRKFLKAGLRYSRLPSGTILIKKEEIDRFLERFSNQTDQVHEIASSVLKDLM